MKKISRKYTFIFICAFLTLFFNLCYAEHTEVYMNTTLGVSVFSPSDWYLEMRENPSPEAKFAFNSEGNLYALFSKYDFRKKSTWPNPLGSTVMIYLFPPSNATAMQLLDNLYQSLANTKIEIFEPPHEVKFNNQTWAVMGSRLVGAKLTYYQITYATRYPNGYVQIQAGSTDADYTQTRKMLDTLVSRIIFDTNKDTLLTKTTLQAEQIQKNDH